MPSRMPRSSPGWGWGVTPLPLSPPSADVRLDGDYVDVRGAGGAGDGAYAEATPEEEALLRRFMPESTSERRTLADIIMEKIKAVESGGGGGGGSGMADGPKAVGGLDPKVVEVYTEVRAAWAGRGSDVTPPCEGLHPSSTPSCPPRSAGSSLTTSPAHCPRCSRSSPPSPSGRTSSS